MQSRRVLMQRLLALIPASIVGRGFLNSARVPAAVAEVAKAEVAAGPLGDGWHLFEACGESMFPVYGSTGGLTTRLMSWIVRAAPSYEFNGRPNLEVIPVEFSSLEFVQVDLSDRALRNLIAARIAWAKDHGPRSIVQDGDGFPLAQGDWQPSLSEEDNLKLALYLNGIVPELYGK